MKRKISYQYGLQAEQQVIKHYQDKGFALLKHRYKTKAGEIDLILQLSKLIVFVEVKARRSILHFEFLNQKHISRYCDAASIFLSENNILYESCRFDLVIVWKSQLLKITENAWVC